MHARLEKYLLGKRFCGVEIEFREGEIVFHAVILRRSGNRIGIEKAWTNVSSVEKLRVMIPPGIPACVTATGKGILCRPVKADQDAQVDALMKKAFPDIRPHDFYCSSFYENSGEHHLGLVRKKTVDEALESFVNIHVISLEAGALPLHLILPFIETQGMLIAGNHRVERKGSGISFAYECGNKEQPFIDMQGEPIEGFALLAFACAYSIALPGNQGVNLPVARTEFLAGKLFRGVNTLALVTLLVVLSANFLAFSYGRNKLSELESLPDARTDLAEQIETLQQELDSRKDFLQNTGLLGTSQFGWYADQLAHSMPDGIQLTRMNFSPEIKLAVEDSIGFDPGKLVLAGNCEQSVVLNQWLQQLRKKEWIKSATLRSFEQDRSQARGVFILDLQW